MSRDIAKDRPNDPDIDDSGRFVYVPRKQTFGGMTFTVGVWDTRHYPTASAIGVPVEYNHRTGTFKIINRETRP